MSILKMNKGELENALTMLGYALKKRNAIPVDIVICGGASLIISGMVSRPTRDVDVLGLLLDANAAGGKVVDQKTLPEPIAAAVHEVATELKINKHWFNSGPSDLVKYGLPSGFIERLTSKRYGEMLTLWLISRYDQIHFKLYAADDTGPGRHTEDLKALQPTAEECAAAAHWVMTHDPSEGFRQMLIKALEYIGHGDVAARM
jgi:hypothetical protein